MTSAPLEQQKQWWPAQQDSGPSASTGAPMLAEMTDAKTPSPPQKPNAATSALSHRTSASMPARCRREAPIRAHCTTDDTAPAIVASKKQSRTLPHVGVFALWGTTAVTNLEQSRWAARRVTLASIGISGILACSRAGIDGLKAQEMSSGMKWADKGASQGAVPTIVWAPRRSADRCTPGPPCPLGRVHGSLVQARSA